MIRRWALPTALLGLVWLFWGSSVPTGISAQPDHAGATKRSSSVIAITPDGDILPVDNPDSNSISLISLDTVPIGASPLGC
jgi:hypothetical protein